MWQSRVVTVSEIYSLGAPAAQEHNTVIMRMDVLVYIMSNFRSIGIITRGLSFPTVLATDRPLRSSRAQHG